MEAQEAVDAGNANSINATIARPPNNLNKVGIEEADRFIQTS